MINPKEKAEELWNKFFNKQIELTGNGDGNLAVECALICVDELINEHTWNRPISWNITRKKYYENVKQELKKCKLCQ